MVIDDCGFRGVNGERCTIGAWCSSTTRACP